MKKLIIIIIVLLVLLVGGFFYLNNSIYQAKQAEEPFVDSSAGGVIDFDKTGRLVMDVPGLKPGAYYLNYEEPGKPALTAELIFDRDSTCSLNGIEGECPDILLAGSSLTRVEGMIEGSTIRVVRAVAGE
jgi:hypothetical protein